jgi:steroid delta-isomerase-like uncharacterized protein
MNKIRALMLIAWLGLVGIIPGVAQVSSTEGNKAAARKLFEIALNGDNWDVYNELHAKDFIAHGGSKSEGLAEDLSDAKGWRQAFPDGRYTVEHVVAEGDLVVVHYVGRGTNTGAGNGLPATGKRVEVHGITLFRFVGGKIAEEWTEYNMLSLLRQLGLAPPMN